MSESLTDGSTEVQARPRKRRWRRKILLTLGLLKVFVVLWIFWPLSWPALRISPQTTVVTGPLNPDGTVNYVAALNAGHSAGVTAGNNAATPLLRALGPEALPEEVRRTTLQMLGIDELSGEGQYFVSLDAFLAGQDLHMLQTEAEEQGWASTAIYASDRIFTEAKTGYSPEIRVLISRWLEGNSTSLEQVSHATRRPRFYLPLVSTSSPPRVIDVLVTGLPALRDVSKAVFLRGVLRVEEGQLEEAWVDAVTLHRLAALPAQQDMLVARLVGIAIDRLGSELGRRIANSPRMSAPQARRILAQLQVTPEPPIFRDAVDRGERYMALDTVMTSMRTGPAGPGGPPLLLRIPGLALDVNGVLRRVNLWYDRNAKAFEASNHMERQRLLEDSEAELDKSSSDGYSRIESVRGWAGIFATPPWARRQELSTLGADLVLSLVAPRLAKGEDLWTQAVMERRLAVLALALAAYHCEKGAYPQSLDALAPDYLDDVPLDEFTGQPLRYVSNEHGYLLYSLGPNGKDDGGTPDGDEIRGDADDIVVRAGTAPGCSPAEPAPKSPAGP